MAPGGGEFTVPAKPDDLVGVDELDADDALRSFNGVVDSLCDSPTSIAEPDHLSVLCALIRGFADVGDNIKSRVFDVLLSGLSCLAVHSDSLAAAPPDSHTASEFREVRNALRIHAFLLKWMASLAERAASGAGPEVKVPGAKGAKGKGKAAAAKPKGRVMESWTWDNHRVKLLQGMRNLLLANLERVWSPVRPEEEFASLFVSTATAALANAAVAKDKDARSAAVAVLLRSAAVMGQRVNVVSAVMNLLHNHEHMPGPAVELVVAAAQQGERDFVSEMMREFGCVPMNELARDAAAARNFAGFLGELAEIMPGLVLSNMSVVNPHLQLGESYVMRNAVLHAIGYTLIELSRMIQRERTETALKTREALLQIMRERVNDVNAFTRSKVLQVWAILCDNDAIPKKTQPAVVQLATVRLEDKSAQVRKSAIQLLRALVQKNPYAHTLPLSVFKEKLTGAEQQLEAAEQAVAAASSQHVKAEDDATEGYTSADETSEDKMDGTADGTDAGDATEKEEPDGVEGKTPKGDDEAEAVEEVKEDRQIEELRSRVNFYQAAVQFVTTIHKAVGIIESLLRSTTTSDVVEAMHFLVGVYPFQMEVAQQSTRKMLLLVWSKETAVAESVVEAYHTIFLAPLQAEESKEMCAFTANRLCELVRGGSVGELASLEKVMQQLASSKQLPSSLLLALWDLMEKQNSMEAASLLSLCAGSVAKLLCPKLKALLRSPALQTIQAHPVLSRYVSLIAQRMVDPNEGAADVDETDRKLMIKLLCAVIMHEGGGKDDRWLPAAEQALSAIVKLHPHPHSVFSALIRGTARQVFARSRCSSGAVEEDGNKCEPWRLARFLHVLGHVSVKQLALVEDIGAQQQREKQKAEDDREANKGKAKSKKEQEDEDDLLAAAAGPDAAVADTRAETARELCEKDLLQPHALVGMFGPLVRDICSNKGKTMSNPQVRTAAVLAMCKLMCVSAAYCEDNLQLLFSIMISAPEPEIRSNIVVALGDLAFRWTNLTEPWMSHIYALLRDKDTQVRHNTLTVLTHLVLNDMVKVRGQVSEMALCLEDADDRIQDMARLFFGEFKLKQQGMLLYNLLPDMVSRLSTSNVEEGKFRRVIKYVFAFVDKAKQTDGLVDKFCQRFRATDDQRQWRDIGFCLNNLTLSEKGVKKMLEENNFKAFADKLLHDDDVANSFMQIVAKAKKLPGMSGEKKDKKDKDKDPDAGPSSGLSPADELEQRLQAVLEGAGRPVEAGEVTGEEGEGADGQAVRPAPTTGRKSTAAPKGKKAAPAKGRGRKKKESEEEESEQEESGEEEEEAPAPKKASKPPAKAASRGKKKEEESEQEESAGEEEDAPAPKKASKPPAKAASKGKKKAEESEDDDEADGAEEDTKENRKSNVKAKPARFCAAPLHSRPRPTPRISLLAHSET
jgi:condensin complex subunit 1